MATLQKQAPGAMGVYAAEELLRWIEDFPCLSYRQRMDLVAGRGTAAGTRSRP